MFTKNVLLELMFLEIIWYAEITHARLIQELLNKENSHKVYYPVNAFISI